MNQTLGTVECEHGHKNHLGILNDIKATEVVTEHTWEGKPLSALARRLPPSPWGLRPESQA